MAAPCVRSSLRETSQLKFVLPRKLSAAVILLAVYGIKTAECTSSRQLAKRNLAVLRYSIPVVAQASSTTGLTEHGNTTARKIGTVYENTTKD